MFSPNWNRARSSASSMRNYTAPMEVAILGGFATLGLILAVAVIAARRSMFAARATADALRKQVRFSSDVFDSLPIGLAMRDLQGRYVFVNRAWERFVGARREDVIGKTIYDRAKKEEADAVTAEDREALARGPGNPTELEDFVYGDRRYMLQRTVITDAAGAPMGVLVASVDTTERRATEQKLEAEQRRFALVVRAANVGILDWDGVPRTAYYSPRFKEILRHSRDADTSGWPDYFELVHPEGPRARAPPLPPAHPRRQERAARDHRVPPAPRRRQLRVDRGGRRLGARRQGIRHALHRLDRGHQRAPLPAGDAALGGAAARGGRAHVAPRPEDAAQQRDRHDAPAARGRAGCSRRRRAAAIDRARRLPHPQHGQPVARICSAWSRACTSSGRSPPTSPRWRAASPPTWRARRRRRA
jgi:PAS domain S-box-containing protein